MSEIDLSQKLDLLKKYGLRTIELLGIGGTSEVTLVENQEGARFALKRLLGQYRAQRLWRDRLLLEGVHLTMARSNRVITCREVLSVPLPQSLIKISVDQDPSALPLSARKEVALLLDFVPGVHLRALLKEAHRTKNPLKYDEIASMIWDISRGLKALHEAERGRGRSCPITHGDLSPTNIMLDRTGAAILIDLSSAKSELTPEDGLIRPGKRAYSSPGRLEGEEEAIEGDLYALACIWFELITGSVPKISHNELSWRALHEAGWPIMWAKIVYGLLSDAPQVRLRMIEHLNRESLWGEDRQSHADQLKEARLSLASRVRSVTDRRQS